jgi:hypothetical protein
MRLPVLLAIVCALVERRCAAVAFSREVFVFEGAPLFNVQLQRKGQNQEDEIGQVKKWRRDRLPG